MRKHYLAIALSTLLLAIVICSLLLQTDTVSITVNGEHLTGIFEDIVATGGIIIAIISVSCIAILLVFVFSGFWLMVLGGIFFSIIIASLVLLPFMFPLLAPLAIVWIFIAITKVANNE